MKRQYGRHKIRKGAGKGSGGSRESPCELLNDSHDSEYGKRMRVFLSKKETITVKHYELQGSVLLANSNISILQKEILLINKRLY